MNLQAGECFTRVNGGCKALFCARSSAIDSWLSWIADTWENPLLQDCVIPGRQGFAYNCEALGSDCANWAAYLTTP